MGPKWVGYKNEVARDKTRKRKTRPTYSSVESLTWFREIIPPFGSNAVKGFRCAVKAYEKKGGGSTMRLEVVEVVAGFTFRLEPNERNRKVTYVVAKLT